MSFFSHTCVQKNKRICKLQNQELPKIKRLNQAVQKIKLQKQELPKIKRRTLRNLKNKHAFSLLETLISISILAILLAVALPCWHSWIAHEHSEILRMQLINAIRLAQQESAIRRVPVVLCKSNNFTDCAFDGRVGLLIFMDEKQGGVVQDQNAILSVIQYSSFKGFLYWRSYPIYRDYLLFLPSGFLRCDNSTFWYCRNKLATPAWAVTLSKTCKMRVYYPDAHGRLEDQHGRNLICDIH